MNILNLPDWEILEVEEATHDYRFTARYTVPSPYCLKCGCFVALQRHGNKQQLFMDLPVHAKRVGIRVVRQRFKCGECGKTFFQNLPDMHETHTMTKRLVEYIEQQTLRRTFLDVADGVGVDEGTVRNIFRDYIRRLEAKRKPYTPEWLGIDEIKIARGYRCVLSDVLERRVFDVLPKRSKRDVGKYLWKLPNKERVVIVCMDMWDPYRELVREIFPNAQVVNDKYHVVRMANDGLETVRKAIRADLSDKQRRGLMHDRFVLLRRKADLDEKQLLLLAVWTAKFPALATAYELKEEFFDIYEAKTREQAEKLYDEWAAKIPEELAGAFSPLTTAMGNWRDEVFAYFDHRATNAYTEALNGLARVVNRNGRGYSFNVLRARIVYGVGIPIQRRPLYGAEFDLPPRTRRFYPPVMTDFIPHFDEFPPMPLRAMLSTQKSKIRDLWDDLTSTPYSE